MSWEIITPGAWPKPPREMSVSTLRAIESCPRRWALSTASYPDLWPGIGYPPRIRRRRLMGSVVHLAIERIVRRLAQANCGSLSDPCGPSAIRELGGFTSIVQSCIEDTVARHANNPRLPDGQELRITLERHMSQMRVAVQSMLRTVPLVSTKGPREYFGRRLRRGPLGPGTYPELEVRAPELHWKGFVDLLALGPDGTCKIHDFKTGARSDDHEFQIRVCSVLWSADNDLNPTGSLPSKLTISYPSGEVAIPVPTREEAEAIRADLHQRATIASELAKAHPPEARPSVDKCKLCEVRQLCSVYWQADTQRRLAAEADRSPSLGDLEVRVMSRRGPVTWDARVRQSDRLKYGEPVVLLAHGGDRRIEVGRILRILDARVLNATEEQSDVHPDIPVASLTSISEVHWVS